MAAKRFCAAAVALFAFLALPLFAQYQTPTLDGSVSGGEYANSSGNWSMTWDATYLYVANSAVDASNDTMIVYLDVDPLSTPGGGTSSNGNLTGQAYASSTPSLPFRADARAMVICGVCDTGATSLSSRDGSGGWGADNTSSSDITVARSGTVVEMRIRWASLPGLSGVPPSFAWLGFLFNVNNTGHGAHDPMPAANPTSNASSPSDNYFYNIASTADGSSTNSFSVQQSTWRTTSNADSGTGTLRDALTNAMADTSSLRRFITFGLSATTITTTTQLPVVSKTTTIDGTSQTGGTAPAVTLHGPGTGGGVNGIVLSTQSSSVVRGLVIQNFATGIAGLSGASHVIAGNYIGTTAAGDASSANATGIDLASCSACVVGGTSSADRNVISGNSAEGITTTTGSSNCVIENNYIGTNA